MFTLGDLSYAEKGTGVIFGFLNQVLQLANKFDYPQFIFAWDSRNSFRRDVYPEYKKKAQKKTQEMIELLEIAKPQFLETRCKVLPYIGFKNSFVQPGIEADDCIAKIIEGNILIPFTIVSSDNDLYQLLGHRVQMYDPKKKEFYTANDFIKKFEVNPDEWAKVKSIAGCKSDNIEGVRGIGEKTAIQYLKGGLKGKKLDAIRNNPNAISICKDLVTLPHPRTQPITLVKDGFSFENFETLCLNYGFQSFLKKGVYEQWKRILS